MSTETNANTKYTESETPLYDPLTGKVVAQRAYNVTQDATTSIWYGDAGMGMAQWALSGQSFSATTGSITAASSNTFGMAVFHPVSTKNMFIYSLRFSNNGGSSMAFLYVPAVNPALGNNATVNNLQIGGAASSIASANITYATAAATTAGTLLETAMVPQSSVTELLGGGLFVPAGQAGGIAVYDYIASTAAWSATVRWYEF